MKEGIALGFFLLFAVQLSAQQDSCTRYYRVQPIQFNGHPMVPGKWCPDLKKIEKEIEIQQKGFRTLKFEICDTLVCPPSISLILNTPPEDFWRVKPNYNPWHLFATQTRRNLFRQFFWETRVIKDDYC